MLFGCWESATGPCKARGSGAHTWVSARPAMTDLSALGSVWVPLNICAGCCAVIWPPLGVTGFLIFGPPLSLSLRFSAPHTCTRMEESLADAVGLGWSLKCSLFLTSSQLMELQGLALMVQVVGATSSRCSREPSGTGADLRWWHLARRWSTRWSKICVH